LTPFFAISSDLWSPAVSAAVVDLVEPGLRAEAFALRRQIGNVSFALGPPLAGLLTLGVGLHWLFVLSGAAELLVFGFYAVTVPETRPEGRAGEPPARLRDAARDRLLLLLALGTALGTLVYVQFDSVLGVFLHRERGVALSTWGLLFAINPVLVGAFQYVVARWAGRRPARTMLALGCVLEGAALFLLWPLTGLVAVAVAVVVLTCGEMLLSPVASAVAASLAPPRLRGSYEGVVDFAFAVAWMPAVFVGLWLVGAGRGELVLALALPISVLGALCFLPLPREPASPETPVAPLAEEVVPV
jgi:predicted MFS family arabinose efflux permease